MKGENEGDDDDLTNRRRELVGRQNIIYLY